MSGMLVGAALAGGVLAAAGPPARCLVVRGDEAGARLSPGRSPVPPPVDLAAALLVVSAQLRAGAGPADAWSRALGRRPGRGAVPTAAELLAATTPARVPIRLPVRLPIGLPSGVAPRLSARPPVRRRLSSRLPLRRHPSERSLGWAAGSATVEVGVARPRGSGAAGSPAQRQRVAAVLAATALADDLGAPLAGVLERMADAIAADVEAEAEVRAAVAGPRATARVLTWLPVLGLVVGAALGADPVGAVLRGGVGALAAALGLALLVVGRAWTRALLRRAEAGGRSS